MNTRIQCTEGVEEHSTMNLGYKAHGPYQHQTMEIIAPEASPIVKPASALRLLSWIF